MTDQPIRRFQTPTGLWWEWIDTPFDASAFQRDPSEAANVEAAANYMRARYAQHEPEGTEQ